jgi:hypothetical protein
VLIIDNTFNTNKLRLPLLINIGIINSDRALKSDSAPPRGGAWETCRAGPTQRRKEVAYGRRARSRKKGKDGCPPAGFAPLVEVQKSGETEKAWDTVPA